MKRIKVLFLILLAINGPVNSVAEEWDTKDILITEGIIIANAAVAANGPDSYGRVMIGLGFFAPALSNEEYASVTTVLDFASIESIGFFNKNMEDNNVSKEKVFYNNLIAWHVFGAIHYLSEAIFGEDSGYALVPTKDGGMLYYSYNF